MKRVVEEQRLGFVATVCPDGTPNLSPKGTVSVWDDDHLVFANIRSPGTLANLRQNANVEVNVVDPFLRKGYRFKGVASDVESGALYDAAIAFYKDRGSTVTAIREMSCCGFNARNRLIRRCMTSASPKMRCAFGGNGITKRFAPGGPRHQQASNYRSDASRSCRLTQACS
jgi:hypothetical protein